MSLGDKNSLLIGFEGFYFRRFVSNIVIILVHCILYIFKPMIIALPTIDKATFEGL